jgi:hypothetical protein
VWGDVKRRLTKKPEWGRTACVCSLELSGIAPLWLLPAVGQRLSYELLTASLQKRQNSGSFVPVTETETTRTSVKTLDFD